MKDLILRFVIGGIVVSAFAALGDVLKPKSFAGLFGAAPSIALATLGLTIASKGKIYAATEGRSMIGSVGLLFICLHLFLADASSQSESHGGYDIGLECVAGMFDIDLVFGSEIELL
jgi:hypothetical protein